MDLTLCFKFTTSRTRIMSSFCIRLLPLLKLQKRKKCFDFKWANQEFQDKKEKKERRKKERKWIECLLASPRLDPKSIPAKEHWTRQKITNTFTCILQTCEKVQPPCICSNSEKPKTLQSILYPWRTDVNIWAAESGGKPTGRGWLIGMKQKIS